METKDLAIFTSELYSLVHALVRGYEKCDRECVKSLGITASQGSSLLAFPDQGNLTMKELSEAMGLAESTMTRVADQLVKKNLVKRDIDALDRRVVRVSLTSKGRNMRTSLEKSLQEIFSTGLADIGKEERNKMLSSLRRLVSAVEELCKVQCRR